MHYYIDGYNLIFQSIEVIGELKKVREAFLHDFLEQVEALSLNATLVFDAQYTKENIHRSHSKNLEIVFTEENETADECILSFLDFRGKVKQCVVVTSDKRLAWHCRSLGAKTQSVQAFIKFIEQRYLKLKKRATPSQPTLPKRTKRKTITKNTPLSECFDYYLEIFEKNRKKSKE